MTIIQRITDRLIQKKYIPEDDREVYEYGFDIVFYTVWSTLLLLVAGLVLKQFLPTIIIVLCFYTFQSYGGGYHANSHLKCFLTMICGLLAGLSFVHLKDLKLLLLIIASLSALVMICIPLTLHPNKSFLESKRKTLSIRSIIVTVLAMILVIALYFLWDTLLFAFSVAFLLAAISRIAGKIVYSK